MKLKHLTAWAHRPGHRAGSVSTRYRIRTLLPGCIATLVGCSAPSDRAVATAGDHELSVDQLVELLARQNTVSNQPETVTALADIWVDYALLGILAQRDPSFSTLDLSPLLEPQLEQEVIDRFLTSVVTPDTALSEQALRDLWDADPPEDSVRARHILLAFPQGATQAQLDSVVELAIELRDRATSGESFEALARRYSEDPGSGPLGGDLGFFGPGTMVQPFEEATYALEVGGVSDPVQSASGLHVIQLVDRRPTTFESGRAAFRASVVAQRVRRADSVYLAALDEEAGIEVAPDAVAVLLELVTRPLADLSARAANRTLVSYRSGRYTAGDLLAFLRTRPPDFRLQAANAAEQDLSAFLRRLGEAEVLSTRAAAAGIRVAEERRDSLYSMTREQVIEAADTLGIRAVPFLENETGSQALDRALLQILREIAAGTREAISLTAVTLALRRDMNWSVSDRSVAVTVRRVGELVGSPADAESRVTPSTPPASGEAAPDSNGG